MRRKLAATGLIGVCLSFAAACSAPQTDRAATSSSGAPVYFSLENYFRSESARLQQSAPVVTKVVIKNDDRESRDIQIDNWQNELMLFVDSDINKPAWQHSFQTDSSATTTVYNSIDPKLRTKQIKIEKNVNGAITHIYIHNSDENMLYTSSEELDYFPDSLYRINKKQRVAIIGENTYTITGTFTASTP